VLYATQRPVSLFSAERKSQVLRWLVTRKGMLSSNVAEAAAFVGRDLELIFAPVLFEEGGLTPPRGHGFTVGAIALQPHSAGVVRLRSDDPREAPVIEPRYLSDPRDLDVLVRGIELARRIVSMPAFDEWRGEELEPGDVDVVESIRAKAQTLYHPVGTCAIGTVVDAELRVRGYDGLRVVDASVLPHVPRGHTHLPTLMVAERAADFCLADARGQRDDVLIRASV
jgi:choline dehydrogenase